MKPDYFEGWLIDLKVENSSVELTFKQDDGSSIKFKSSYNPYFYIICSGDPNQVMHIISQHPDVLETELEEKYPSVERTEKEIAVKVTVDGVKNFKQVVDDSRKIPDIKERVESNFPHYFRYLIDNDLWFFRKYRVRADVDGIKSLTHTKTEDLPELKKAAVCKFSTGEIGLMLEGGKSYQCEITELSHLVKSKKIDTLFSYGGDDFLANLNGINKTPLGYMIPGCVHMDIRKDIGIDIYSDKYNIPVDKGLLECVMEIGKERLLRVMELSRLTGAKPDIVSRVTPGRLNTYLHMRAARKKDYLIPDKKKLVENPKSLRLLNIMDRAGLIFYPEPGIYQNVAKCDFASMYPNIIVNYNISPETMNCKCCNGDGNQVPEAGWHTCTKKKGIIPEGLRPVLEERLAIKKIMKTGFIEDEKRAYDIRQRALKNILVCSFGYLGFRNFVFSNVECKESVMLYGRNILMRTKEIAESFGLKVIYGITDSIFVANGDPETYKKFCRAVTIEMGMELELDNHFKAIAFPAAEDSSGVANKYFGLDSDGILESRGIDIRHSDAPQLLKDFQYNAIQLLLGGNAGEDRLEENSLKVRNLLNHYRNMVSDGDLPLESFSITMRLRRPIEKYSSNAPHVVAGRLLPPGDEDDKNNQVTNRKFRKKKSVTYVYTKNGPLPIEFVESHEFINTDKYIALLERSYENLIRGLPLPKTIKSGVKPLLNELLTV